MDFHATATNKNGKTFVFFFLNVNQLTTEEAAKAKLDKIVAADPLHQRHGPWFVDSYDVGGA